MSSRATVYQGIQIVPEVTPGTPIAATHRLTGMSIDPSPSIPVKEVKYPGSKVATDVQLGQDSTDHSFTGALDYNTFAYIMDSMFGKATPTSPGTNARQRVYAPAPNVPIAAPQSYTIEHGSSKGAEQYGFFCFSDLGITWNHTEANISGKAFSQRATRDFTPTASLPRITPQAVDPNTIGVYISVDGTSYTKLVTDMEGEFHFNGLWAPTFHVNDAVPSFDDVHERMPDFGGTLTVEEGTEADTFMSDLLNGTQIWLGIKMQGALIDAAITGGSPVPATYNLLKINVPCFITKPAPGDKSEVWGNTFTFVIADDDVAMAKITSVSKLSTL